MLLYKRLENGKFVWPRNKDEVMKITDQQFRWLLEGLKIEQPRTIKKSNKRCAI
ncbi:IS66 family insertion sequence element accessory protein TnpB [Holdemanella porci]|uniref:IS66 family insertion sequence element accessory protein TnpB n=1 Tax=Holdemanella porci TaxID=2652276 RepID=UPI003F914EF3